MLSSTIVKCYFVFIYKTIFSVFCFIILRTLSFSLCFLFSEILINHKYAIIKKIAMFVSEKDNNHDGVSEVIEKYIIQGE